MKLLTQKLNYGFSELSRTAALSATIALGFVGWNATFLPAPAQAENPAQVVQLLETGACQSCDLSGADLTGAHLIGVDLRGANLTNATLANANLEGSDLTGATLANTDLSGAFLTNALLDDTVISNADLSNSTLVYTSLDGADVNQVNLEGAHVLSTPISIGGSYDE